MIYSKDEIHNWGVEGGGRMQEAVPTFEGTREAISSGASWVQLG